MPIDLLQPTPIWYPHLSLTYLQLHLAGYASAKRTRTSHTVNPSHCVREADIGAPPHRASKRAFSLHLHENFFCISCSDCVDAEKYDVDGGV